MRFEVLLHTVSFGIQQPGDKPFRGTYCLHPMQL